MCPRFHTPTLGTNKMTKEPDRWRETGGGEKGWGFLKPRASVWGCAILTASPQRLKQTVHQDFCIVMTSGSVAAARHRDRDKHPSDSGTFQSLFLNRWLKAGPSPFRWMAPQHKGQAPTGSFLLMFSNSTSKTSSVRGGTNPPVNQKRKELHFYEVLFESNGKEQNL